MTMIQAHFIAGLMFGIEFPPCEDDEIFVMTLDLGIIRINYIKTSE